MPVRGSILYCQRCDFQHSQLNLTTCQSCGNDLGPPNVNEISTQDEFDALQTRYDKAKQTLNDDGNQAILSEFEDFVLKEVNAVLNVSFDAICSCFVDNGSAYKSYYRLLENGDRIIADLINDKRRNTVDSILWGSHKRNMIFAALSADNIGLRSYGNCCVVLNENSIKYRTSLLEENSFVFVKKHNVFDPQDFPKGYRSTWGDRNKLAVAKLAPNLTSDSRNSDFSKLIINSKGDRSNRISDEFIELFIYNELSHLAVKEIYVSSENESNINFELQFSKMKCRFSGKVFVTK